MSKTLCPLPWIHYATRNNGHLRVCCHANVSASQGALTNEGVALTANNSSMALSRNSETLKSVRQTMLRGEWPRDCARCQKEETGTLTSRRQMELDKWSRLFNLERAQQWTAEDGSIDTESVPLVSYDLRFGNICNLRCRMCGPTDSNSWYGDYVKVNNRTFFHDTHGRVELDTSKTNQGAYNWHSDPQFWANLEKHISGIEYLYLVGGEPLMITHHIDFLERCVSSAHAAHIDLEYNTNMTVLPEKVLALWPHFKSVRIGVSLDGIGSVNEYIRYPSSFSRIIANVRAIEKLKAPNIRMWFAPTVQIFNIFHLTDMIDWVLQENFDFMNVAGKKRALAFHLLHNPPYYSIQSLPTPLKELARERIHTYLQTKTVSPHHSFLWEGTKKNLESIASFMCAKDQSRHWPLFLSETLALDKIRKQNYLHICPELRLESRTIPQEVAPRL